MRIFQWLRRRKATINGVLITIFTSLFFNTISNSLEAFFNNPGSILKEKRNWRGQTPLRMA